VAEHVVGLVAWLRAQLDEDERVAWAALHPDAVQPGTWSADQYADDPERRHVSEDKAGHYWSVAHEVLAPIADHIARHDPARVLRDVAAKRAIVDEAALAFGATAVDDEVRDHVESVRQLWELDVLRPLASAYADRPGYREEWAPGLSVS
jgi:hypothetical protein